MYEYMDSFEKFNEEKLPKIEKFYSSLNQSNISQQDYNNALKIWNEFRFKNIKDYTEFYCLLDTCLLADIFCKLRKQYMKHIS